MCGGPKLPDFSHAIRLGKAVFIALDFRSSRSADLLWTDLNWKAFERHLIESKTLFTGAAHCFAVVPVPPIFLNFPDLAVKLLHALPGHAEPEDDCRCIFCDWGHFVPHFICVQRSMDSFQAAKGGEMMTQLLYFHL